MGTEWFNPSYNARIWDSRNNRTIEPRTRTNIAPDARVQHKFVKLETGDRPQVVATSAPIKVTSQLQIEDDPKPILQIVDDPRPELQITDDSDNVATRTRRRKNGS